MLWAHLKISCISQLWHVWNNLCMCVKQRTDNFYIIICNCIYSVVMNCSWNSNVAVKIVACWNWNVFTSSSWLVSLSLIYTLDVIHLIVTILSDRPSFEWECSITGQLIWFSPLKWTFSTCFRVVVAQHGMERCCLGVWQKDGGQCSGSWLKVGDWVVWTSHFYGSHKCSWKITADYSGCVHFTVDWLFWNLYGSYIAPLLSWKNPGNFSLCHRTVV